MLPGRNEQQDMKITDVGRPPGVQAGNERSHTGSKANVWKIVANGALAGAESEYWIRLILSATAVTRYV